MSDKRKYASAVLSVQPKLYKSYTVAVNATQTFEELTEALPLNVYGVKVRVQDDNKVYYQNGAASTSSGCIQQYESESFVGSKDELDLIELYTGDASANNVTINIYII